MIDTNMVLSVVVLLLSLLASAFLSGVETGGYTINRLRLAIRAERKEFRARVLLEELRHPNRWLSTLLIGNTVVGYLASVSIGHILDAWGFSPLAGMILNAIILLPLLVVFGETLPKEIFRVHCDTWTVQVAPIARGVRWLLTGIGAVPLLEWMGQRLIRQCGLAPGEVVDAKQRVLDLLRESRGTVDERQVAMAGRVVELARRNAGDLMTPWARVTSLAEEAPTLMLFEILRTNLHASYPLVNASNECVGMISAIDLLAEPTGSRASIARPAVRVPRSMGAMDTLHALRQGGASLALVMDQHRPVGVISLRDLLEPVVGRISGW